MLLLLLGNSSRFPLALKITGILLRAVLLCCRRWSSRCCCPWTAAILLPLLHCCCMKWLMKSGWWTLVRDQQERDTLYCVSSAKWSSSIQPRTTKESMRRRLNTRLVSLMWVRKGCNALVAIRGVPSYRNTDWVSVVVGTQLYELIVFESKHSGNNNKWINFVRIVEASCWTFSLGWGKSWATSLRCDQRCSWSCFTWCFFFQFCSVVWWKTILSRRSAACDRLPRVKMIPTRVETTKTRKWTGGGKWTRWTRGVIRIPQHQQRVDMQKSPAWVDQWMDTHFAWSIF